jgi:hypothetical protein
MRERQERTRALDDVLRQDMRLGVAAITLGVTALGAAAVTRIVRRLPSSTTSVTPTTPVANTASEPLKLRAIKIDHYDRRLSAHSPDAADPAVTRRIITIMLAAEY